MERARMRGEAGRNNDGMKGRKKREFVILRSRACWMSLQLLGRPAGDEKRQI